MCFVRSVAALAALAVGALMGAPAGADTAPPLTAARLDTKPQVHELAILRPDLVIDEVHAVPDDDRKLIVRLANQGLAGAGTTNMKVFYHRSGKVMVRGYTVGPISAGGELWVIADIGSPLAHASAVQLRVDDPNRIPENSESNNGYIWK